MRLFAFFAIVILASCGPDVKVEETTVTTPAPDTCNDPDAGIQCCFSYMPVTLTSTMNISGEGTSMIITGNVLHPDGLTPYPDVIIYAYHTDTAGLYSKKGDEIGFQKWHGRLHGWCKTDEKGRYEIHSIRPAPYPDHKTPAHIHMALKEPNIKDPYYINDIVFSDDTLVTKGYITTENNPGGSGVIGLKKNGSGAWTGKRIIIAAQ